MQLKTVGETSSAFNAIQNVMGNASLREDAQFSILQTTLQGYSTDTVKAAIAQSTLTESQIKTTLAARGFEGELLNTTAAELAQTTQINALNASETTATGTTSSLGAAFQGLAAKIGISTAALGALVAAVAAVAVAAVAFSVYKQHMEEIRQTTEAAASAYADSSNSIEEYIKRYQELQEALVAAKGNEEETYNIKKQLFELQTELNDKFGDAYGNINLVTDAYKDQTDAIKNYNKEAAQTYLNENRKGIETATKKMEKENVYQLSPAQWMISTTEKGMALKEIAEKYNMVEDTGIEDDPRFRIALKADATTAYETINSFEKDLMEKAKELGDENIFKDILDLSSESLNRAKSTIDDYGQIYEEAQIAEIASDNKLSKGYDDAISAVEQYNEAVMKSEDPYNDASVKAAWDHLQTIKKGIQENEAEWGQYSNIMEDVFDTANDGAYSFYQALQTDDSITKLADDLNGLSDVDLNAMAGDGDNGDTFDKLMKKAEEYGLEVQDVIDLLTKLGYIQGDIQNILPETDPDAVKSVAELIPLLDSMKPKWKAMSDAYQEFMESGHISPEKIGSMTEEFGNVDGLDVSGLLGQLATADASSVPGIFNNIAAAFINASGCLKGLTDETERYVLAELEANGMADIAAQVHANSAAAKLYDSIVTDGLTASSFAEIAALITEGEVTGLTAQQLAQYTLDKLNADGFSLNTAADIENLLSLAIAADATAGQIIQLDRLKRAFNNELDTFSADGLKEETLAIRTWNNIKDGKFNLSYNNVDRSQYGNYGNYDPKSNNRTGGAASGSKGAGAASAPVQQTAETFNFIETGISRAKHRLDMFKTTAAETFLTLTERNDAYSKSLTAIADEIYLQNHAQSIYMDKANSVGLEAEWVALVQNGDLNISEITDDGLKERIKSYKEWYEKVLECQKALQELGKTQKELTQEKIELQVKKYDQKATKAESEVKRIQNYVDLKEAYGEQAGSSHYKGMNKYTQRQIKYTIKQNDSLRELQKTTEKGSDAWNEHQKKIDDNNNSIKQLTKSMAENAAAAAATAGQTAERKNKKEDTADEKIDAKLSTSSNNERTKRLLRSKITNIDDRQNNLKKAYASSVNSRAGYGKKIQNASRKGVSKKNKKLFTTAISYVKKKKAIPTKTINDIVNALKSAEGNEYNSLSKLLSYCNYYNAYKNAEEENKLNYEMYALTAQADKKALREEQLQSNLDNNQKKADRNTMSTAETAAGKNHNVDANARLAAANATSYKNSRVKYENDRDAAAKKADFSSGKEFDKLKNSSDLKASLNKVLKAIKDGKKIDKKGLEAVKKYCKKYLKGNMTYYYNCEAYNEAVENVLSAKEAETLANAEAYATKLQAKREKAANTVAGRDSKNELYSATAANQTTARAKNGYVDKQISNINKNLVTYKNDYNTSVNDFNDAKSVVTKTKEKDSKKKKIINDIKTKYVNKNILIPSGYIDKAYSVSDAFGLACENYNEALENKNAAEETYNMYGQTSKTEISALAMEKLSNIEKEYSNKQSVHRQHSSRLNSAIELTEAKGYQVSKVYYSKLIAEEQAVNSSLVKERQDLINSLNDSVANGTITKYSDEWYEMCSDIDDVTASLDESTKSLVEFQNQMRQIDWDNFDYLQSHISEVSSEISFLIDELSREDLSDDEAGSLTDRGNAVAALRAMRYESYRKQAADYEAEIKKIDRDLTKTSYDKTLLERRNELVQSYQDCIKGAQDEKYAIMELYEQGYESLSEKIGKLISDYEKLLDAEKDAYDYQNDITDKTKEIADLQKQIEAYGGDISEETKAKVQTLKVSLEEAEKNLKETQYDKYISDTKDMLSELQEDMDEAIQDMIDAVSKDFDELVKNLNDNYTEIRETIKTVSGSIGYTPTDDFNTLLNNTNISAAVTSMVTEIKNFHTKMTEYADRIAQNTDSSATADNNGSTSYSYRGSMKAAAPSPQYSSGSRYVPNDQGAWTQEEGGEIIYRASDGAVFTPLRHGDMVFTNEMSKRLWEIAQGITPIPDSVKNISVHMPTADAAPIRNTGDVNINLGGVTMNGVNDPREFEANLVEMMNRSPRVKKVMNTNTVGALSNGYNSLSGQRFSVRN